MGFKTADETERALGELVKSGVAEWVDIRTKKKGQPARGIRLRHIRQLTPVEESSGLASDVLGDDETDDIQSEPEPERTTEQPEIEVPEELGEYMDFLDDSEPF